MFYLCLSIIVLYGPFSFTGACTFPANLTGTWISADRGELLFNSTSLRGYPTSTNLDSVLDLNCQEQSNDIYFLMAEQFKDIFGRITRFYLCLQIIPITENMMIYYIGTEYDKYAQDTIYGISDAFADLSMGCDRPRPYEPETFITLIRKDTEAVLPNDTCPTDLLAKFENVTITASNGVPLTDTGSCQGSTLDVCTDRSVMQFNNNCTSPRTLSADGAYTCLYALTTSGDTYLSVWNNDASVDGTNTFQFSCFAFRKIGDVIYATETPEYCSNTTTSSSTNTGLAMFFTSITETCIDQGTAAATAAAVSLSFLYALLIIPIILLILLLVLLFLCLKKKYGSLFKRKKDIDVNKGDKVDKKAFPKNKLTPFLTKAPSKAQLFRPKRPIDISIHDLNFETGSFPIMKPISKIAPIYKDSIVDYVREKMPRRPSGLSLYSFDSIICKENGTLHDTRSIFTPSVLSETMSRPSTRWSIRSGTSIATTDSQVDSSRASSRASLVN